MGAFILLAWSLRPNIARLLRGEERLIGWRAKRMKQAQASASDFEPEGPLGPASF